MDCRAHSLLLLLFNIIATTTITIIINEIHISGYWLRM
jgi:hypothetical protein